MINYIAFIIFLITFSESILKASNSNGIPNNTGKMITHGPPPPYYAQSRPYDKFNKSYQPLPRSSVITPYNNRYPQPDAQLYEEISKEDHERLRKKIESIEHQLQWYQRTADILSCKINLLPTEYRQILITLINKIQRKKDESLTATIPEEKLFYIQEQIKLQNLLLIEFECIQKGTNKDNISQTIKKH